MAGRIPGWYRPMTGRPTDERHRAATPLELLFDLCFVVAVAQAAAGLHHGLDTHRAGPALAGYAAVFFAIWWPWVNFTWFASAYDTDDVPYRLATFVQIAGSLVIAAGVPRAFDHGDFRVITAGYVVMRVALVGQWLRAAHGDRARRSTALRFAIGVTAVQAAWVARLALPAAWRWPLFFILVPAELAVPVLAERASRTPYHREHIAERYGLFTLIVLGEAILGATLAVQVALDTGHRTGALLVLAAGGLVTVFAMWWLYFDPGGPEPVEPGPRAFLFGYGHYLVFASVAGFGAGIDAAAGGELSDRAAALAVTVPVAVFLLALWLLRIGRHRVAPGYPVAAAAVVLAALTPVPLPVTGLILVALVAVTGRLRPAA